MTGDELITYGFKRVVDEMQKNREVLEKIEQHLFTLNTTLLGIHSDTQKMRDDSLQSVLGVYEIKRKMGDGHGKDGPAK